MQVERLGACAKAVIQKAMVNAMTEFSADAVNAVNAIKAGMSNYVGAVDDSYGPSMYVDYTGDNWALYFTANDDGSVTFDCDFTADGAVDVSNMSKFIALLNALEAFCAAN